MPALDTAVATAIVNATLGLTDSVRFTGSVPPMRIRFMSVNGSMDSPGQEIPQSPNEGGYVGGDYAPVIEFNPANGGVTTNLQDVTVAGMPECTITGVEIYDSSTGSVGDPTSPTEPSSGGGVVTEGEPVPMYDANGDLMYDANGNVMYEPAPSEPTSPSSGSAGVRVWFGALSSPKNINAGDTFTIAAGSLTVALA